MPGPTPVTVAVRRIAGRDLPGRAARALVARPAESGDAAYPVVAFGHGFLQRPWRYRSLLTRIAAAGYLVVAPGGQSGPLPRHGRLADDLRRALDWARRAQPGAGHVPAALVGHSMGAGAALLAATAGPDVAAVVAMSALDTRPSCRAGLAGIAVPVRYVVGSLDTVVPPSRSRDLYAASPPTAEWASIQGGGHCGFLDSTFPRGFGCGGATLDRAVQVELAARLIVDWLDRACRGAEAGPAPDGVLLETRAP